MNRLSKISSRPEASSLKIPHTEPNIHSAIIHRLLFHLSDARIQH
ncbi:spore protease YyaC, partial [Clostridium perfringens]